MKIAYVGYGVLGKHLKQLANNIYSVNDEIYFDDLVGLPLNACKEPGYRDYTFLIAIGYKHLNARTQLIDDLLKLDRNILTLISPSAYVAKSARIGHGCIIYPMSNIDEGCNIGNGNIIHNSCTISHNTVLGISNYLSPGTIICGDCKIGTHNFIGTGSTIANGISIGNDCMIGMSSSVQKSLPDNSNAIGNPLRILSTALKII